jgi:hypothetical protein
LAVSVAVGVVQSGQILIMGDGVMVNAGGVITVTFIVLVNEQPYESVTVSFTVCIVGVPLNV